MEGLRTTNASPIHSKIKQRAFISSSITNATVGDMGTSYSTQYAKKCRYKRSHSRPKKSKKKLQDQRMRLVQLSKYGRIR